MTIINSIIGVVKMIYVSVVFYLNVYELWHHFKCDTVETLNILKSPVNINGLMGCIRIKVAVHWRY